ncbi:hypothetical protein GE061_018066 [Apolygus lucorum]|uniref:Uncharacterized protein n=1 Tax=Apolygus lucorum TaxID=248454 RepID=A0A8S9XCN3_APOLU|nr:hypothetical protein GE061_018066 [Apolygus lucorum]
MDSDPITQSGPVPLFSTDSYETWYTPFSLWGLERPGEGLSFTLLNSYLFIADRRNLVLSLARAAGLNPCDSGDSEHQAVRIIH